MRAVGEGKDLEKSLSLTCYGIRTLLRHWKHQDWKKEWKRSKKMVETVLPTPNFFLVLCLNYAF